MTSLCRNPTAFHQYTVFIHMPTRCDLQNVSVILSGIHHVYLPDFPINSSFLFASTVKQLIFASNSTIQWHTIHSLVLAQRGEIHCVIRISQ